MMAPNKLTLKMLAAYLQMPEDFLKFEIARGTIRTENWYGESVVDEQEAREYRSKGSNR